MKPISDFDPLKLLEDLQCSQIILLENQQKLQENFKNLYLVMQNQQTMIEILHQRLELVIERQKIQD